MKWSKPHYTKNGNYVCVLSTAKDWVNLTIFNDKTLEAPEGLFEPGDSPDRKTIKIRKEQDLDYDLVAKLLQQAANS